jgi:NADH dehydrogenase [ubiquinone] 1 alpha subcomplex assembly factor 7
MGEANGRYYAKGQALGASGDFVTAPEISQMFGELIGAWCADLWQRAGQPGRVQWVELGPGRGTLAADAGRVMARAGFKPTVHFVEASPGFRKRLEAEALDDAHFHDSLASVPRDGPVLVVANEFFDALPIRQLVRTPAGWRERMVALDEDDRFIFVAGAQLMDAAVPAGLGDAPPSTIIETCPAAVAIARELADRIAQSDGAALIIDYGHLEPRTGSTFQAVRAHAKADPLEAPGQADLTAHVDFAALKAIAGAAGLRTATTTQGAFLERLGITQRANALVESAPERREELAAAHRRLCSPEEMGALFKILTMFHPDWPEPAGFG